MPTLILTPRYTEDAQALWRAAGQLGWNVERLTKWRVPPELRGVLEPVLYLEGLTGPTMAAELNLRLIEPPLDWLPRLPEEYRKRWVRLSTLSEARSLSEPAFIKPPNDKSFPAEVDLGANLPAEFACDMPVLVAEIVAWENEFRCFIPDRQLRTFSIYLRNGELQRHNDFSHTDEEEAELKGYVEAIFADGRIDLPRSAVLDVGVIRGRGWAVVEQNAAWGSGLYGCDPVEVLDVLRYTVFPA